MQAILRFGAIATLAIALAACGKKAPAASPTPSSPPLLIDSRGVSMPLEQAVTKISYRPYLPPAQVMEWAVIPPLGGNDTPANRGIAAEYAAGRYAVLLSQWPKQHLNVTMAGRDIAATPCVIVRYSPTGVGWSSHRGFVMTLQSDGSMPQSAVNNEAKRLLASGACK